jgi:3-dehydroquinate dehydratase-2
MKILVINGPNINLLGIREPAVYGRESYDDLCALITKHGEEIGVSVEIFQSNHEGALVDEIQKAYFDKVDGIVINPGAYTHTSIAILDALKAVQIPTVEVHISAVNERESYRQVSFVREFALATVSGKGINGYAEAMDILVKELKCAQ